MNNITRWFKDINKSDTLIAGGKGASLGEMTQAGISIPNGFVVTADTFDYFLKKTGLITEIDASLDSVDLEKMHTVERASENIQSLLLSKELPNEIQTDIIKSFNKLKSNFVAVRSSATSEDSASAAWAGQLESYLNTTKDTLLENVKKCWASLFCPRAIFYRFEQKLEREKISVAVVVQKMVQSEVSGIAFSVHPVTQDTNQIIIEAGFGLGESIVSGTITPDSFVVSKSDLSIVDITINIQEKGLFGLPNGSNEWRQLGPSGENQALNKIEIITLSKLIIKIENHYGFPCDIEWAKDGGKFYITQSRPITTLSGEVNEIKPTYYFSWGERHSVISAESWLRTYLTCSEVIANDNHQVFMLVKKGSVSTYNTQEDLKIAHQSGLQILERSFLKTHLENTNGVRQQFSEFYALFKKQNLEKLTDQNLLGMFQSYQELFDKTWAYFKVSQPEYLEPARLRLMELLQKQGSDATEKFITLTTPTDIDLIKEEELAAYNLSLKKQISETDLENHAEKFPWLFFNTYDRSVIDDFLQSKFDDLASIDLAKRKEHISRLKTENKKHNLEVKTILSSIKNKGEITYLASVFRSLAVDRLKLKSWWGGGEYLFLSLFDEISSRAKIDTEELLMTYKISDIESFLSSETLLNAKIRKMRRKSYAIALEQNNLKFYETADSISIFMDLKKLDASTDKKGIVGTSANLGKAKGRAYIVRVEDLKQLIDDMKRFKDGDILVTTMTQPTMVSLARRASAIVTDEGGITSHASILAREYNIPCVVGTNSGTNKIKTGDIIEVDATAGVVNIIKSGSKRKKTS